LKEEALERSMWRNRFGGGFEPVVRQNTERMNMYMNIPRISHWSNVFYFLHSYCNVLVSLSTDFSSFKI